MHGCCSMWINTERTYRYWETINIYDGFSIKEVWTSYIDSATEALDGWKQKQIVDFNLMFYFCDEYHVNAFASMKEEKTGELIGTMKHSCFCD